MAKTRFVPMFPLKMVVFPGEQLNLHIFEPRYKQLIMECEKEGITFGIIPFIDNKLMEVGTEIRLIKVAKRYENGEMDIFTEGLGIFKVSDFYSQAVGKMYGAADIIDVKLPKSEVDFIRNEQLIELASELFKLMKIQKELPTDLTQPITWRIAHYVGFTIEQEYEFLLIDKESARLEYMIDHLNRILPVVREMEHLRQRALLNGHFKNIVPPQF